jgi:rod shape-determining protein MreD
MIKTLPKYIIQFFAILIAQLLIFNNMEVGSYMIPYIYVLFIILLPFETPGWLTLILGFIMGLIVDIFCETIGIHTAATVLAAFIRPYVLSLFAPREGYEPGTLPRVNFFGFTWFIKYAVIMVLSHHLLLFYLEMFSFRDFFPTFLRVMLSTGFSSALIVVSQFFVFRK